MTIIVNFSCALNHLNPKLSFSVPVICPRIRVSWRLAGWTRCIAWRRDKSQARVATGFGWGLSYCYLGHGMLHCHPVCPSLVLTDRSLEWSPSDKWKTARKSRSKHVQTVFIPATPAILTSHDRWTTTFLSCMPRHIAKHRSDPYTRAVNGIISTWHGSTVCIQCFSGMVQKSFNTMLKGKRCKRVVLEKDEGGWWRMATSSLGSCFSAWWEPAIVCPYQIANDTICFACLFVLIPFITQSNNWRASIYRFQVISDVFRYCSWYKFIQVPYHALCAILYIPCVCCRPQPLSGHCQCLPVAHEV